ncbi:MAG: hypothetical protein J1E34_04580 [Oscillospiraceae bacterium]|nr:hypothetical protein [Oscillospiraceae bacterium]
MLSSKIRRAFAVLLLTAMIISSFTIIAFAKYENTHKNTGNTRTDITEIAKTQLGYSAKSDGSTKYDKFLSSTEAHRGAAFIVWCANEAGVEKEIIPFEGSVSAFKAFFADSSGFFRSAAFGGGYDPFEGDIAFISSSANILEIDDIGIVTASDKKNVSIIHIADGKVKTESYALSDEHIAGYASPSYKQYSPSSSVKPTPSKEPIYLVADISKFNAASKLKWDKFSECGVEGVIIRIAGRGYGPAKSLYKDTAFLANYNAAKAAGLHIGVYFFSYALTKAQALEEAELTIDILESNNIELDMPVFIDIEDYSESDGQNLEHYKAGKTVCSMVVNTFCDAIKEAGYYPGVYCNKYFAETLLEPSVFSNRAVWIAQYGVSKCGYSGEIDMWQYTNTGKIPAFSGAIDLSYCYTDFPSLINPSEDTSNKYREHIISDKWEKSKEPSRNSDGEKVKTCVDCGKVLITQKQPCTHPEDDEGVLLFKTDISAGDTLSEAQLFLFHSSKDLFYNTYYDSYVLVGGTLLTYCKQCKKVLSTKYSTPGESHDPGDPIITKPTCSKDGKTAVPCSDCEKIISETIINKTEHTEGSETIKKTNCSNEGQIETACSVCGEIFKTDYLPSYAHSYTKVKTLSKVTLTSEGKKKYTCEVCGNSFTEKTPSPAYCDVNLDGSVTASDARLALRAAVKLDNLIEESAVAADADNSKDVTAADARLILRIAVELDDPEKTMASYYK